MIDFWIQNSLQRIYKYDSPKANQNLRLNMAKNDIASFQVGVRKREDSRQVKKIRLEVEHSNELMVRVRKVEHVPVPHFNSQTPKKELVGKLPGYVPDPLLPTQDTDLVPGESNSFWISLQTGLETNPGTYKLKLHLASKKTLIKTLETLILVHPVVIEERNNFPVTHWFCADSLCDFYSVDSFKQEFWPLAEKYMKNLVSHGINVMHTPIFTPPTDGVKRPHQLLKIKKTGENEYSFDWTDVKHWVNQAQKCGMKYFEWVHLFSQWGVEKAIRIYENYDNNYEGRLLWPPETCAASKVYYKFLSQFLPEFKNFLEQENLLSNSFFHLSDEPKGETDLENYKKARSILSDLAPWMKVMDAVSETEFAQITDMPIAKISSSGEFMKKNIEHWDYFCCNPRGDYLNRLLDTPLAKIRGAGWLFYRFQPQGFLHWGYNYWYKSQTRELIDPFKISDGKAWPNWAYGDPFVVYPGKKGPIDSIRWEVFAESLRDFNLLSTLSISFDNQLLTEFKSYRDYPKSNSWYWQALNQLFNSYS